MRADSKASSKGYSVLQAFSRFVHVLAAPFRKHLATSTILDGCCTSAIRIMRRMYTIKRRMRTEVCSPDDPLNDSGAALLITEASAGLTGCAVGDTVVVCGTGDID